MKRLQNVREGQHYAQIIGPRHSPPLWQVVQVYQDGVQIAHACLVKIDNPLQTKTISCSTLTDPKFFTLVGNNAAYAA